MWGPGLDLLTQALYEETVESVRKREAAIAQLKLAHRSSTQPAAPRRKTGVPSPKTSAAGDTLAAVLLFHQNVSFQSDSGQQFVVRQLIENLGC